MNDLLEKEQWKTIDGKKVTDMPSIVTGLISERGREVHIGTDSQQDEKWTQYVTVLVFLEPGKGGRAFYFTDRVPRIRNLRERLLKEVWMSTALGIELSARFSTDFDRLALTVHIDANPNVSFRSSDYVKELTSMVVSQGFKALLKPDSWAAAHVADHTVKAKVLGL